MATKDPTGLEAGQVLALPRVETLLGTLGIGVARAQEALDQTALDNAVKLLETTLDLPGPPDAGGQPTTMSESLLALGVKPTFFQLNEATIDLQIDMRVRLEESTGLQANGKVEKATVPVAVGGTVSHDQMLKYGSQSHAMTHLRVGMVATPAPQELLDYIRRAERLQARGPGVPPAPDPSDPSSPPPPSGDPTK
jgi:hypothetical protein